MVKRVNAVRAVGASVAGAGAGAVATVCALPYLRQIDPLGLTPVVLVSLVGGFVLGWYVRARSNSEGRE